MKNISTWIVCLFFTAKCFAQKDSLDLIIYTPLKGWSKEEKKNLRVFTYTDKKDKSWCQVGVYKSTNSKGSIEADFESEWNELAATPYRITEAPEKSAVEEAEGWKIISGSGKFTFNGNPAGVIVTTFSGYNRCVSIVATTANQRYLQEVMDFIGSVELKKPATPDKTNDQPQNSIAVAKNDGFAFSSTNFDDGWTSTVQEDWVEVKKGSIKVLLHYPKAGTIFPADPEPMTNAAWNILVAPRYSNLKNYKTAYIATYDRPYLGMGYATEKAGGRNVFIVFFHRGSSVWMEFVAPDKNAFIEQYKFDPETIKWDSDDALLNPLLNMSVYNKFAVAASDLKGKWTSDFTGIQQLYNVYTGAYAGMNMNQSNEEFIFSGNNYNWKLLVVNGMAGNAKFNQVKSSGIFTIPNNWQVHFTMIESRAKTYHAFWSCIKGARILNLLDAEAPGSGIYTKYGLAK